ncbi:MAG: hypothetical protein HC936_11320 [Leptolyngbyaceae cyanobacterium SU_3_3]|nr:hypothetical protein [Leptolyngbyaceae cyanobacterium SU_3_3]
MFARTRRFLNRFFNRARTINNEPLNKVSLIVLILIDLFILFNVFAGLDDISRWHVSPSQAYPCYSEWKSYQDQTSQTKEYDVIRSALTASPQIDFSRSQPAFTSSPSLNAINFRQAYQQAKIGRLGNISETCLTYADFKDKLRTPDNQKTVGLINQKQNRVGTIEQTNRNIRAQYDSTLLEKIAGQPRGQSINSVAAEKAKQELDQNNRRSQP